jgi:5'-deoxynucleotidase YfbR-like HD superfamily hydrolase
VDYRYLTPVLLSVIVLSLVPAQNVYACDFVVHPEKCTKDLIHDIVDPTFKDIKDDIKKVEEGAKHDITKVEDEVESLESDVVKELKTIGRDIENIAKDVESTEEAVVGDIVKDTKKIEEAIVGDLVTDVKDIKKDINKIDDVIKSVEAIEKRVVNITEEFIKTLVADFIKDFWYIVYGIVAIGVGYLVIRIVQFAIWLKAYLRQDGIEHNSKKVVKQNDEIIKLLQQLLKK